MTRVLRSLLAPRDSPFLGGTSETPRAGQSTPPLSNQKVLCDLLGFSHFLDRLPTASLFTFKFFGS